MTDPMVQARGYDSGIFRQAASALLLHDFNSQDPFNADLKQDVLAAVAYIRDKLKAGDLPHGNNALRSIGVHNARVADYKLGLEVLMGDVESAIASPDRKEFNRINSFFNRLAELYEAAEKSAAANRRYVSKHVLY